MAKIVSRSRGRRTVSEINMVPFIDVMLVLLIIFMVTAPLITPSQIDLPSIGQASRQPDRFIQVIVDRDDRLQVREGTGTAKGADVTLAQLVTRLQQMRRQAHLATVPVVISADKNVKYETVVQVMDTLQRAGVQRVGLSVQSSR